MVADFLRASDVFAEMDAFRRQLDTSFLADRAGRGFDGAHGLRHVSRSVYPYLKLEDAEDAWTFTADLPGFLAEQVSITLDGDVLTLAGDRRARDEGWSLRHGERSGWSFSRQIRFQAPFDAAGISAEIKDGVLRLRVPKAAAPTARTIAVRQG